MELKPSLSLLKSANIISIPLLFITCTADEDDDEIVMLHPWKDRLERMMYAKVWE